MVTPGDLAVFVGAHGLLLGLFFFANLIRGWVGVR